MAHSFKSSISFGLVYIPITLHAVIKNNDIGFNMIHKKTKKRIKYVRTCDDPSCPADIDISDIVKGYEYEKGKYVIITNEELQKLKTKKDESINILLFADISEIDPIYFDKSYYVMPTGAKQAFELLLQAMQEEGKVAIAKVVLGQKETMVCIRAKDGVMYLNTMYFYEEVQEAPYKVETFKGKDAELKLTKTIIKSLTQKFKPEEYKDEYRIRLQKAIDAKINGEEIKREKSEPRGAKVLSLIDALELTLKQNKTKTTKTANKTTAKTKSTKTKKQTLPKNVTKIPKAKAS